MITSKVIMNPSGYVEMSSYQNLGETFSVKKNNYFPINLNTLVGLSAEFSEIEIQVSNGEIVFLNYAGNCVVQILTWLGKTHYYGTRELGKKWEKFISYMLATVKHETSNTYDWGAKEKYNTDPKDQFPGQIYFKNKYDIDEYGNKKGTLDYYNFRGKSLVQLTWRGNYEKVENEIKIYNYNDKSYDWTNFHLVDPNSNRSKDAPYSNTILEFVPAMYTLSYGMIRGWFRSKHTLEKYYKSNDWFNARKIIQPLSDQSQINTAKKVEGYYNRFYSIIHSNSEV